MMDCRHSPAGPEESPGTGLGAGPRRGSTGSSTGPVGFSPVFTHRGGFEAGMISMDIDLKTLSEGLNLFTWEATAADLDVDPQEVALNGPARVALTVVKVGDTALTAHGEVAFGLHLACSRCLEPVDQAVDVAVRLILQKGRPESPEDREGLVGTDLIFYEEGDSSVDVVTNIRDAIILEVPLKPLCSEGCEGLCPFCGANRNRETCSCRRDEPDPRWEALKRFKPE